MLQKKILLIAVLVMLVGVYISTFTCQRKHYSITAIPLPPELKGYYRLFLVDDFIALGRDDDVVIVKRSGKSISNVARVEARGTPILVAKDNSGGYFAYSSTLVKLDRKWNRIWAIQSPDIDAVEIFTAGGTLVHQYFEKVIASTSGHVPQELVGSVSCAALSDNGKLLATSFNKEVKLYSMDAGGTWKMRVKTIIPCVGPIEALAIRRRLFAASSKDIYKLNISDLSVLEKFGTRLEPMSIAIFSDNLHVAYGRQQIAIDGLESGQAIYEDRSGVQDWKLTADKKSVVVLKDREIDFITPKQD